VSVVSAGVACLSWRTVVCLCGRQRGRSSVCFAASFGGPVLTAGTVRRSSGCCCHQHLRGSVFWAKVRFSILLFFFSECVSCVLRDVWLGSTESLSVTSLTLKVIP